LQLEARWSSWVPVFLQVPGFDLHHWRTDNQKDRGHNLPRSHFEEMDTRALRKTITLIYIALSINSEMSATTTISVNRKELG
jgi:hypothetical protein